MEANHTVLVKRDQELAMAAGLAESDGFKLDVRQLDKLRAEYLIRVCFTANLVILFLYDRYVIGGFCLAYYTAL